MDNQQVGRSHLPEGACFPFRFFFLALVSASASVHAHEPPACILAPVFLIIPLDSLVRRVDRGNVWVDVSPSHALKAPYMNVGGEITHQRVPTLMVVFC